MASEDFLKVKKDLKAGYYLFLCPKCGETVLAYPIHTTGTNKVLPTKCIYCDANIDNTGIKPVVE